MPNDDQRQMADLGTYVALLGVLLLGAALLGLVAMVLPNLLVIVAVALAFGYSILLHYFVWGYWLANYLRRKYPDEADPSSN